MQIIINVVDRVNKNQLRLFGQNKYRINDFKLKWLMICSDCEWLERIKSKYVSAERSKWNVSSFSGWFWMFCGDSRQPNLGIGVVFMFVCMYKSSYLWNERKYGWNSWWKLLGLKWLMICYKCKWFWMWMRQKKCVRIGMFDTRLRAECVTGFLPTQIEDGVIFMHVVCMKVYVFRMYVLFI